MALLPPQRPGNPLVYANAAGGGDEFLNSGRELLHVRNGGGAPITVTINSQRPCDQGFDHDSDESVPAGDDLILGPYSPTRFNDGDGNVQVTYSDVTSVTVAVISPS